MGEWNDAHKTSENIYELMKKVSKKQTDQQLKDLYIEFFGHLSHIFWESELYLFHTYALHNMQYLIKSSKGQSFETRQEINNKFVLSALAIPLKDKQTSFDKLSFNYMPECMKGSGDANPVAREEILNTAKMLQVEGYPSRQSIITSIKIENIQHNTSKHVSELFRLIEEEDSPFTISKQGKVSLDALCNENPALAGYRKFIERTLSVRILQKCKNFYRNMKLSKLAKMLHFYSPTDIERLLYECNREGLISTTISSQDGGSLTFNPEAQVADNLATFGNQLKIVFQKVVEA